MDTNPTRRSLVAGALGSALALNALGADPAGKGEAAPSLLVVQIGNLGDGMARADAAPEAVQLGEGMAACLARVNALGGVRGRPLAFVQLADQNDPARFIGQFRQAAERGAVAVLCPYGGVVVKRLLDEHVLDAAGPAVVGAVPGAEAFRKPGHAKLLHVRAGDGRQIASIIRHAHQLGIRRVAALVIDNDAGLSALADARQAAEAAGAMAVAGFPAQPDPASLAAAAHALAKSGPECAVVVGPPQFMADCVPALRAASFRASVYALSYLSPELLVAVAHEQAAGVAISQVFPNPGGIVLPLVRDFRAAMQRQFASLRTYSAFQLEGYLCARVLVEGLRRARAFDGQSLALALRSAGRIDFDGYTVDFSPATGGGSHVDIGIVGRDGRLQY